MVAGCDDGFGACHFCRGDITATGSNTHPESDGQGRSDTGPAHGTARSRPALQPGRVDSRGRVVFGPIAPPGLIDELRTEEQKRR